jgi:Protein of unknown function (DUF3237).|nr:MAG: DUF3237 domain-containing protein [Pseudomonadota bacterium]
MMSARPFDPLTLTRTGFLAAIASLAMLPVGRAAGAEPQPADFPQLEHVYTAEVEIGPAERVGETLDGVQRIIPITGGTFEGPAIRGTVIPGGADWNLARNDGSTVVEAYYFMRTSDGVVIKVFNRGVLPPRDTQQGGAQSPPRPAFTTPVFEAPRGKYEWLNSGAYLGTITPRPGGGAVIIRVFRAR